MFTLRGINSWYPTLMLERGLDLTKAYGFSLAMNFAGMLSPIVAGALPAIGLGYSGLITMFAISPLINLACCSSSCVAIMSISLWRILRNSYAATYKKVVCASTMKAGHRTRLRFWYNLSNKSLCVRGFP